ncbi:Dopey, N-terminal-domain-containing protein [Tuber brumale]|nr:Dopey, N-terminal-domain-containing protein [Tuber brumale]
MSLDPGSRIPSPLSSGRSSPQPRSRFRNDDEVTRKDPKYKRYSTTIDRALSLFESYSLQEWADYISFLGRLLKALQSHPSLPLIPSKALIAKRLAQCLNPQLPSGVHQKTIEVYSYIFSMIGREGLAADLTLWTPGLAPVLSYASLTLKPHYLTLLERFYLPLSTALRPALKSLILALLPGIDEEGGEYFDRTLALIDEIRNGVCDDAYFWQCFLLATITSPGRRQGALAFLGRRLPKLDSERSEDNLELEGTDSEALISPEPGLLIRAFCAGLNDEQILVQRGFLDLLVGSLPLCSKILQGRVSKPDLELLVTSAAGVVLRRDMSLNRRLWAWYLGPEGQERRENDYFGKCGLNALIGGLEKMLDQPMGASSVERAKPYRICLSLMDRWEVGSLVVPKLFLPVIESVRQYEKSAPSKEVYTEVLKSARMFFDGVEASLIWGQILERVTQAFSAGEGTEAEEMLEGVRFVIRTFNVNEEEMVVLHTPLLVLATLVELGKVSGGLGKALQAKGFRIAEDLWRMVPERVFNTAPAQKTSEPEHADNAMIMEGVRQFYRYSGGSAAGPPFSIQNVGQWVLREAARAAQSALTDPENDEDIRVRCHLLVSVIQKTPQFQCWKESIQLAQSFLTVLSNPVVSFAALQGIANVVAPLYIKSYISPHDIGSLILPIVKHVWGYLSPDRPKFHVEAVKVIWNLQMVLADRKIEAAIATVMTEGDVGGVYSARNAEHGRKFGVLWMHSSNHPSSASGLEMVLTRPLFLFLDALGDDGLEVAVFARAWLQNLGSVYRLFSVFITKLLGLGFLRDPGQRDANGAPIRRQPFGENDDLEVATYYFQTLSNILQYSTNTVLAALASELVIGADEARAKALVEAGYGEDDMTLQTFFVKAAVRAIEGDAKDKKNVGRVSRVHRIALKVLHQLLLSPFVKPLVDMELENVLTARLISALDVTDTYVQVSLLDVLFAALKLSLMRPASQLGQIKKDAGSIKGGRTPISVEPEKTMIAPPKATPPQQLLKCLIGGFSSSSSRPVLDSWVNFLAECLPLLENVIFQILMPLVECLCEQIRQTFHTLKQVFRQGEHNGSTSSVNSPEGTLVALLHGLEQILAAAHDKLVNEEIKSAGANTKSPDAPTASTFFGNMVSGVFAVESPQHRSSVANNRLTVLLCFKDTVKSCYEIWSWGDSHAITGESELDPGSKESWQYISVRMRGRARRILEHLFGAETLECLETLIELWPAKSTPASDVKKTGSIFRLINVLDGSRPKHTIPAIFNAIYSRTNPAALEPNRKSALTAELQDLDVVVFLVEYARSLEDDAMDEIWADCMVFLKDVLANPFPHRQTLPSLLSFTAILGEKVDNTNFGEQRRMRKELGDLFIRLLTAAFTVKPIGQNVLESPAPVAGGDRDKEREMEKESGGGSKGDRAGRGKASPVDIVAVLVSTVPELRKVLVEPDRVVAASIAISTNVIGPTFRSKSFPHNVTGGVLDLLYQLTRLPNNQKAWKKELSDAFLDPKFFSSPISLVRSNWVPLARQFLISERERMTELLGRITPPTTAGVLFGVGATSARQEADKKTQLNLRRIAFLIFAAEIDTFIVNLPELEEKLVELLSATAVTSPSSATRGDIYLVFRALALRTSPVHISSLWPLINTELQSALSSLFPDEENDIYTDSSILQACKLLDTLLVIAPDEFQLHEWLFVTDTIEAVYRPSDWNPTALVDQVASELPSSSSHGTMVENRRRPWLAGDHVRELEKGGGDIRSELLRPFFGNLSIFVYEATYGMRPPDIGACEDAVLRDLFSEEG